MKKILSLMCIFNFCFVANSCAIESCNDIEPAAQKIADSFFTEQFIDSAAALMQKAQEPIKDFLRKSLKISQLNKEQLQTLKKDLGRFFEITTQLDELRKAIDARSAERFAQLVSQELAQEIEDKKCVLKGNKLFITQNNQAIADKLDKIRKKIKDEIQVSKDAADYAALNQEAYELREKTKHFFELITATVEQKIIEYGNQYNEIRDILMGALLSGISDTVSQAIDECIADDKK